jgi:hypothetical protein
LSAVLQLKNEQKKATENYTMRDFTTVSTPCAYFYGVTKRMGLAGHVTHMGKLILEYYNHMFVNNFLII